MTAGYIYILVNSSIDNMVKVGKTTRLPKERAMELSNVTGIPTPFVVAESIKVNDCDEAEKYMHKKLTKQGYRVNKKREFFMISLREIMPLLIEVEEKFAPLKKKFEAVDVYHNRSKSIVECANDYNKKGDIVSAEESWNDYFAIPQIIQVSKNEDILLYCQFCFENKIRPIRNELLTSRISWVYKVLYDKIISIKNMQYYSQKSYYRQFLFYLWNYFGHTEVITFNDSVSEELKSLRKPYVSVLGVFEKGNGELKILGDFIGGVLFKGDVIKSKETGIKYEILSVAGIDGISVDKLVANLQKIAIHTIGNKSDFMRNDTLEVCYE